MSAAAPTVPAATCSFDVAVWLMERARADDSYLQPRKLQSLMFLAQAHFAAVHGGRRLMPSIFLFDEGGALDPNTYRAFENGRPSVTQFPLSAEVTGFLDAIWRRYADCDALRLDQIVARQGAAEEAIRRRDGSEITIEAMVRMFAPRQASEPPRARPEPPRPPRPEQRRPRAMPPLLRTDREPEPPPAAFQPAPQPQGPRTARTHDGRPVTVRKWVPGMKAPAL